MSNVKAVESAQAAQKAAERKAVKDISDYKKEADKKVSDAVTAKNTAIRQAKDIIKASKKSQQIAWGSTLITLLCCLIAYPVFSWDVWYFVSVPATWAWDKLNDYAEWMEKPYYSKMIVGTEKLYAFSTGWAWTLRVLTFLLILICVAVISFIIAQLVKYYKKRWCNLSLKVLLASLAVIIVFGECIRDYISINLVLLFIIIQAIYLGVLVYLDRYFDTRNLLSKWEEIQKV